MPNQGRSNAAVVWMLLAVLGISTAVILSFVAMDASPTVAKKPLGEFGNEEKLFEETDCQSEREPIDRNYLSCLAEYKAELQEDAATWAAEVQGRQADIETKGNLALVFGLAGVVCALGAVVAGQSGGRAQQQFVGPADGPPGTTPGPAKPFG